MKKIKLILLSLLIATITYAQENPNQAKIEAALMQSFTSQSNKIDPIVQELKQDESTNSYWIAYGEFYSSIFYMQTDQKDEAEEVAHDAIEVLKNVKEKDSEDHALLGYILGYSISFDPESAMQLSSQAARQYRTALKKNENNLRAYLGMGESDFHKPEQYGGGEKVEEYLQKAISLPAQTKDNGPSWGKNSAYYTLAKFYQREGEIDKAKMYCMKGLNEFPKDYQLNQLKQSF